MDSNDIVMFAMGAFITACMLVLFVGVVMGFADFLHWLARQDDKTPNP